MMIPTVAASQTYVPLNDFDPRAMGEAIGLEPFQTQPPITALVTRHLSDYYHADMGTPNASENACNIILSQEVSDKIRLYTSIILTNTSGVPLEGQVNDNLEQIGGALVSGNLVHMEGGTPVQNAERLRPKHRMKYDATSGKYVVGTQRRDNIDPIEKAAWEMVAKSILMGEELDVRKLPQQSSFDYHLLNGPRLSFGVQDPTQTRVNKASPLFTEFSNYLMLHRDVILTASDLTYWAMQDYQAVAEMDEHIGLKRGGIIMARLKDNGSALEDLAKQMCNEINNPVPELQEFAIRGE